MNFYPDSPEYVKKNRSKLVKLLKVNNFSDKIAVKSKLAQSLAQLNSSSVSLKRNFQISKSIIKAPRRNAANNYTQETITLS